MEINSKVHIKWKNSIIISSLILKFMVEQKSIKKQNKFYNEYLMMLELA